MHASSLVLGLSLGRVKYRLYVEYQRYPVMEFAEFRVCKWGASRKAGWKKNIQTCQNKVFPLAAKDFSRYCPPFSPAPFLLGVSVVTFNSTLLLPQIPKLL